MTKLGERVKVKSNAVLEFRDAAKNEPCERWSPRQCVFMVVGIGNAGYMLSGTLLTAITIS